jgi:LmbE family N-acetylglucosaminyl deacetylase
MTMSAIPDDLSGRSLLAVFAHPDDESLASGGLLAHCAARDVRVSLLCLTHGEHGPRRDGQCVRDTRARELHEAARVLGIRDVVLLDHEDGMLPWIDTARLDADILDAIDRFRPEVVVTFDEDGLYWHPDHIAVHERTTAVVAGLGTAAPTLWYVSMPAGAMRTLIADASAAAGRDNPASGRILGVDADGFGSMAPTPTFVVEAGVLATRKLAALRCHRSQVEGGALERVRERDAARLLGTEHYRRADVGSGDDLLLKRFGAPAAVGDDA